MAALDQEPIKSVLIDGGVVMKIVNHCHQALPQPCTGQLLGLDRNQHLEVTATFPYLSGDDDGMDEEAERENNEYQFQMMSALRDVNVDANSVGWYYSSWDEDYLNTATIDTQYSFQKELGRNSIFIVYDPLKTTQGKLWMKAFRLRETFLPLYEQQDFMQDTLTQHKITYNDIFEELPIEIHNNHLTQIFISELASNQSAILSSDAASPDDSFQLRKSGYLNKSLESLMDSVDSMMNAYNVYAQNYKKYTQLKNYKEDQAKAPKPSRLDTMLVSKAIMNHCGYMEETAVKNFENLFFAQTIHESETQAN
eukprot:TRINITY_DN68091_c5_g3_i1.p1 TRINITY_DN68091_c5_g3~~TRINITY_DN68091_c5_g3_i1.p1  ORF type:complete len:310 (-),score=60.38 TRINITY_DN68091_c5_g3_i1:190-1119(-)